MPTYKVTDPVSGKTLKLTGDSPPKQDELERIFAKYQPQTETVLPPVVAETAGAINRGVAAIPDFFIDAANAAISPFTDKRIPRAGDVLEDVTGSTRNFMEPGLARDFVQVGGEWVPALVMAGRDKFVQATRTLTPEMLAAERTGATGNSVINAGKEHGVPVLTSDLRQPKTFLGKQAQKAGERIPVVGTQGQRAVQQEMRNDAASRFVAQYDEYSYGAIVESLKKSKDRIKTAAGNVLTRVGGILDDADSYTPTSRTASAIQEAKAELIKPGKKIPDAFVAQLDELDELLKTPQSFSVLKDNRTWWRGVKEGVDEAGRSQLPSYAKAQAERVYKALGDDMDDFARAKLTPRDYESWKKANSVYAEEAIKYTKTRLKSILDKGQFTPESAANMLFSSKPSEVQSLYKALTPSGRANARAAIINKVTNDLVKRAGGFTPNSFVNELKKYESQIGIFFKGDERKQLEGLRRVLESTMRAQEASVSTQTGQEVYTVLSILGIAISPKIGLPVAGMAGGLARLYESAPVRNALLRLSSVPKGTTAYDDALATAVSTLLIGAQKLKSEPPQEEPTEQQQ